MPCNFAHSRGFRPTNMPPSSNHPGTLPQARSKNSSNHLARSLDRSPPLHSRFALAHSSRGLAIDEMALSRGRARLPHAAVVALAFCVAAAAGQGTPGAVPSSSCASKLTPCVGYLNTTATPQPSCCEPLKEAAATEAACMCAILVNKATLQAFGVEPEQGLLLAKRCGVTTDASTCAKYTSVAAGAAVTGSTAASSASTGTAASTVAKPTASGGNTHRLSLIAASSLIGFSFIWWTIVA